MSNNRSTNRQRGICECGCGQRTRLAPVSDRSKGWIKGEPLRFVLGHHLRHQTGERAPRWKGGRHISSHGYVALWTPEGRRYEHVVVAERALGRPLRNFGRGNAKTEVVHHINGDKQDNLPQNLLVCTHRYHVALHHRLEQSRDWPQFAASDRFAKMHAASRKAWSDPEKRAARITKLSGPQMRTIGVSGYRGVEVCGSKWRVRIRTRSQNITVGVFGSALAAAMAYDAAVLECFGSAAITNKSLGLLE